MALISCSNCGKAVSDKAKVCPGCGAQLIDDTYNSDPDSVQMPVCEECGEKIPAGSDTCPNCGCPVPENGTENTAPQKVEITAVSLPKIKHKTKKGIIIGVLSVLLIAIIAAVGVDSHNKKAAELAAKEYHDNLKSVSYTMLLGAVDAEDAGNLIKSVWYNSIYEEKDPKTDKYTRPNGYFYDDFNDALAELFSDSSFKDTISNIKDNQNKVADLMKSLKNPPDEYKEAYEAAKKYYDEYLSFTNLVANPSGSLQTFSSNFNNADTNTVNAYNAMKMYTDD